MEKDWKSLDELYPKTPKVRKWSEKDITIKLRNLGEKIGWMIVYTEIEYQKKYTDNICDAMNLAFYSLKNKFSKICRSNFGFVRVPEYEPKKTFFNGNVYDWYNYKDCCNVYTTSYTTSASSYYGSIW